MYQLALKVRVLPAVNSQRIILFLFRRSARSKKNSASKETPEETLSAENTAVVVVTNE